MTSPATPALARAPARHADDEPAFLLVEPMRRTAPLIFASPHSGRRYPAELLAGARASLAELRRSEDAYVDELFAAAAAHGAPLFSAHYARAYVDLNRAPEELDREMFFDPPEGPGPPPSPRVQAGLGVLPRVCGDGEAIYAGRLAYAEAARRIARAHQPYHERLADLIDETRAEFGCAILIDCHSMPSCARGPGLPDIVLGDRHGVSCHPALTSMAEAALRRLGYRVARNAPFAGGYVTQLYGRPADGVHALQIEINRGLYMNERTLARLPRFERVRDDLSRLVETLAAAKLDRALRAP